MDELARGRELLGRAWRAYDTGDEQAFASCVTADWVEHDASGGTATLADVIESMRLHRTAFPDKRTTILRSVAEGDLVVTQTVTTATHRGEYFGVAPTGKQVVLHEMLICRIADERIAECWEMTSSGFLEQLTGRRPDAGDNQA